MGSKSVGEPPLLLSTSALTAFQAAIAAAVSDLSSARNGSTLSTGADVSATSDTDNPLSTNSGTADISANLGTETSLSAKSGPADVCAKSGTADACAKPSSGAHVGANSNGSARSGGGADVSAREAAVQQLCAPVTVRAVRAAVGSLGLASLLDQYA